jgi:hypothetical protein
MNRAAIFVLGLVLVCLSAWTSACSSNPTPHPANDATGVPLSDATGDTSGPAPGHDTSSDSGQFSDLVSTPDGVAGDSSADVPADGEVGADTDIDGGPEVDAGACSAANMPCCCDFDVVAEAVCGGGAWTCPLGFAPYFGLECTRDCGPCFYAPACAEADAGSGPD